MKLGLVLRVLLKDLRLGPRSPVFLFAVILPVVGTLVVQAVFGTLLAPQPRLGIVDLGTSEVTAAAARIEGIDVSIVGSADELRRLVLGHDLDAGLVLAADFDQAIRDGRRPLLELYISGQSLASDRLILAVTTIDLVRAVESVPPPVAVEVVEIGEAELSIAARITPLLVLFTLLVAGVFLPALSIVQERERGTLTALLITPVRIVDVLLAKGLFGFLVALVMAYVTLLLNGALGRDPVGLLVVLLIAAVLFVQLGLIYGTAVGDAKTLFTLMKSLNVVLVAPVVFYLFPDWPQWIARLFPTYWVINPIFEVGVLGTAISEVAWQLGVALVFAVAAIPVIVALGRRMQGRLAVG